MPALSWSDEKHALGMPIMDDTHREFIALVNTITDSPNGPQLQAHFAALLAHTTAHFEREETLMRESNFSAYDEHRSDHQRILGELTRFNERVARGSYALAKAYVVEQIPRWFELHAATMDAALACHLANKTGSQKPSDKGVSA